MNNIFKEGSRYHVCISLAVEQELLTVMNLSVKVESLSIE